MLKIAFINPPHADWSLSNNLTYLLCQSHYQRNGKYREKVKWLPAPYKWNEYKTSDDVILEIEEADIILFSSYVWNYTIIDDIAKKLKKKYPNKILCLGGPHVGTNEPDLLLKRKFYDFICLPTKPGEVFVESLIDSYFENNKKPKRSDIMWEIMSSNRCKFPFDKIDYSVYEDHEPYIKKIRKYAEENNMEEFIVIETTRGCPYSCVFCEWGGGIETKILKKDIEIVKKDIDSMVRSGYKSAYLTDANFGVFFERDIEIFKYAWSKGFNLTDISTMKSKDLQKRKKLIDAWFENVGSNIKLESSSIVPTVSIQSISERAMKIAKRVDLSLNDKLELSRYIGKKCQENNYPVPALELILAMPGSTIKDFYDEMEIIWNFKAWGSYRHDYMFLPDSTLNSNDYKKEHEIKTVEVYSDIIDEDGIDNLNGLYKNRRSYFKTILSCFSFTEEEMYEMWFMNSAANYLLKNFYEDLQRFISPGDFCKICYSVIQKIENFDIIQNEIKDIFNPKTKARSIRKLCGKFRVDTIEEFLDLNKSFLISEVNRLCLS